MPICLFFTVRKTWWLWAGSSVHGWQELSTKDWGNFILSLLLLLLLKICCLCVVPFGVSIVQWCYKVILRNLALFLCIVLYKWISIANKNCDAPLSETWCILSVLWKCYRKKGRKKKLLCGTSHCTSHQGTQWHLLLLHFWDSHMNTCSTEQNVSSGREDVSAKWENKRNGWSPIMHAL